MFFESRRSRSGAIDSEMSGSEVIGECGKPVDYNVGRRVGDGVGRAGRSPLVWAPHKGSAITDAAGRIEVEIMARHHQDLARLDSRNAAARR